MFQGDSVQLFRLADGLVELRFDRRGEAINKLDERTIDEFRQATTLIAAAPDVRGVLVTSAKEVFIVGADITEFGSMFLRSAEEIAELTAARNQVFVAFEDLPVPTVATINGFALGGGLELTLAASFRVMSTSASVGVPEVKLGLFPALGGTVRLSRVAGPAVAIDWILSGKPAGAAVALEAGVVDTVAEPDALRESALSLLERAVAGEVDWQGRQQRKRVALPQPEATLKALFDAGHEKAAIQARRHKPAATMAIETIARAAVQDRAGALSREAEAFGRVCKSQAAGSLVQTFLNEQAFKKRYRQHATHSRKVRQVAVVGAGIMGGGIAYTIALNDIPVRLKDISAAQLEAGMSEATRQLARQVTSSRLTQSQSDKVLGAITSQLDNAGLAQVDLLIEAVVENLEIKHRVLAELEAIVGPDTLIASNTSSLRIDDIARPLQRPENVVGMHFFNPVPAMALVEVIQGSKTSDAAVSAAVGLAVAIGKTPIVVKDCPGVLVNRIVTPYINAFLQLVADGADFEQVDRVMEAFGWPMGPAYLQDVVGMDISAHVSDVIGAGYPQRMQSVERNALKLMVEHKRYGQKTGAGFYLYEPGQKGKTEKKTSPDAHALVATLQPPSRRDFSDSEIMERMMLPMLVESAAALEEGVVATPAELDMALLLGLGFPAYAGGPMKYADWLGLRQVVALCDKYSA
ncbi:fatty acid oxidation complex subunit alpha FadB, partial [Caballeronia mineralivorans]|uniref:fatty acid oxidation complex subunit alpha FadB n=1 Tax=Caballeronia mineralivorans TaxID=2010198 RepID=UPI002AFF4095